jgi:hypothetical protein
MRTISKIALVLAVAGWTFATCDACASECSQSAAVASAEATLVDVQARLWEMQLDPPSQAPQRRALLAVVRAARSERQAALAVCTPTQPPAYASPFEIDDADPWEHADAAPDADGAWCAVMGCDTSADSLVGAQ